MNSDSPTPLAPPAEEPKLVVYEAPPIFVTARRIAEWLGVTYSAAAKIVYRGDLGPWAKIGNKLIVRSEAVIEAIKAHEKPGWSSWHRTGRTYPRPDPKILELLRRPPRQPGSKNQREAEATEPIKTRLARWRDSGKLKPDPLLAALLNREITQKEYDRLKSDRKLGKRIHAALSKGGPPNPASGPNLPATP